jgi:hypothetical protein
MHGWLNEGEDWVKIPPTLHLNAPDTKFISFFTWDTRAVLTIPREQSTRGDIEPRDGELETLRLQL